MRKILTFSILFIFILLAACSSSNDKDTSDTKDNSKTEENEQVAEENGEDGGEVEVNKGLLNVEVTLPAAFFEDVDIDETVAEAKEQGIDKVKVNDDGSLTYKMSKKKHKEMLAEIKAGLLENIEELINDEDFASIKDIKHDKELMNFTLVVDQELYEEGLDGFATLGLGISGLYYQLFNGVDIDENKITIQVQDEASGEAFDEVIYPDVLDEF